MNDRQLPRSERHALAALVWRTPQVHLGVGVLGNALFITGTILFMTKHEPVGMWFFLLGSSGMLLASVGEVLRAMGRHRLAKYDVDPAAPDQSWSASGHESSALEYSPRLRDEGSPPSER